jgi:hypothetical protein
VESSRSQDWFHGLDHETKAEYRKKYPGTKFVDKTHLRSAKQVGLLYHATPIFLEKSGWVKGGGLVAILKSDTLNGPVSFSRNKRYVNLYDADFTRKPGAQLVVDGDKLSSKYKIQPYQDPAVPSKVETEEVVPQTIKPLHTYLKEISILTKVLDLDHVRVIQEYSDRYDTPVVVKRDTCAMLTDRALYDKFIDGTVVFDGKSFTPASSFPGLDKSLLGKGVRFWGTKLPTGCTAIQYHGYDEAIIVASADKDIMDKIGDWIPSGYPIVLV